MKKYKSIASIILILLFVMVMFFGCNSNNSLNDMNNNGEGSSNTNSSDSEIVDNNEVEEIEVDTTSHNFKLVSTVDNIYTFECQDEDCEEVNTVTIICDEGTECVEVSDETISFKEITENTVYSIVGTFYGNITIDPGEGEFSFELSLQGLSLTSENDVAINVLSGEDVILSAKKNTDNFIYDIRKTVDENGTSASIYSKVDLSLQGKGSLSIKSENNNGIHTKDDLNVKNLTLQVDCLDNSLKGNDGVTIESGSITLIARQGDCIKTSNSHVSDKGKQKGDIKLKGGDILLYAACDGMDAAHDVTINEKEGELTLQIFTDKFSKYSEEVTATSEDTMYIRFSSTSYKYSIEFKDDENSVWQHSSSYKTVSAGGMGGGTQYYYPITKPSGYTKMKVYIYSSSQTQGDTENYLVCSDYITINENYDTFALTSRNSGLSYGWTNYSTQTMGPGGMGGMQEGNSDKGDYSTKGIKADNEISISAGDITISAYDDAIHTNNDVQLGEEDAYYYGTGNIVISGGNITIHSNDDGIHADGSLSITDGSIIITNSYEGLEGDTISISGGTVSIKSSDDGMNSCATTGTGISITGGTIYVYAGGDGLDSNTKTSGQGLVFNGGKTVVISTGNADSSLDTENGYTYTSGYVIAIGRSGGMNNEESTNCSNFSSVATSKSLSLTKDNYLVVNGIATIKMPTSIQSFVVVLGQTSLSISSSSSSSAELDNSGVCWN